MSIQESQAPDFNYKQVQEASEAAVNKPPTSKVERPYENRHFAIICFLISLVVGAFGVYKSYGDAKEVGGDAYNYIIGAGRGTAIVGFALIFALLGVANAVLHVGALVSFYSQPKK